MEENRKPLIISGVGLAVLMGLIALLITVVNPWEALRSLAIGSALGIAVGIVFCWYFLRTWDPVTLQRAGKQAQSTGGAGCWLPFVTIGGVVAGQLLSTYFASDLVDILVSCFLTALALFGFVVACLAWWHRPRKRLE